MSEVSGSLGQGLRIRPSTSSDQIFLQQLHRSCRNDLLQIDADQEFIESIIALQFEAQGQGYGDQFPNALYFIVEKLNEPIGRVTLNFGETEVHLVDMAFIPAARGRGYGVEVIRALQQAATQSRAPLTLTVLSHNMPAKRLYQKLGFVVESVRLPHERMIWYPAVMSMAGV